MTEPRPCAPVPCPPFQEVDLNVAASAPFGHLLVDGVAAEEHISPVEDCPICQEVLLDNGWLRELPPDLGPVTIQPDSVVHEADPFTQAAEDGAHMPDEIDPEFGEVISEIKESKGG